jgi:hypothetical protein
MYNSLACDFRGWSLDERWNQFSRSLVLRSIQISSENIRQLGSYRLYPKESNHSCLESHKWTRIDDFQSGMRDVFRLRTVPEKDRTIGYGKEIFFCFVNVYDAIETPAKTGIGPQDNLEKGDEGDEGDKVMIESQSSSSRSPATWIALAVAVVASVALALAIILFVRWKIGRTAKRKINL